jgi:hypothetical protein
MTMTMAKSDEQRRALRLLARSPNGCAETVLLENGFSYEQLLALVFDGFATIRPSVTYDDAQNRIIWMKITAAGQRANSRNERALPRRSLSERIRA